MVSKAVWGPEEGYGRVVRRKPERNLRARRRRVLAVGMTEATPARDQLTGESRTVSDKRWLTDICCMA